jgi:hypothetical protein
LGLEVELPNNWLNSAFPPKLLPFVFPRILIEFDRELHLEGSHYTEFAVWCAKNVSEGLR